MDDLFVCIYCLLIDVDSECWMKHVRTVSPWQGNV